MAGASEASPAETVINRIELGRAWRRLSEQPQEALALVVFDSHENGAVAATVMNGYFVLWMPGDEWKFPAADTTVTVTLADGTSQSQVLTP